MANFLRKTEASRLRSWQEKREKEKNREKGRGKEKDKDTTPANWTLYLLAFPKSVWAESHLVRLESAWRSFFLQERKKKSRRSSSSRRGKKRKSSEGRKRRRSRSKKSESEPSHGSTKSSLSLWGWFQKYQSNMGSSLPRRRKTKSSSSWYFADRCTVDGRNPAPPGM